MNFKKTELELLIKKIDYYKNPDIYKKLQLQLNKYQIKNIECKNLPKLTINERKHVNELFKNKDEKRLLSFLENKDPNSNIQIHEELPEFYHKNDMIISKSIIFNMLKLTKLLIKNNVNTLSYSYEIINSLAYNKNKEMIDLVLTQSLDINKKSIENFCPINQAIKNDNIYLLKKLIKLGLNINNSDFQKMYPIHNVKSKEALTLLLKNNALINVKNQHGDSPLVYHTRMISCNNVQKTKEIIVCLIENNADLNIKNKWGYSFIDYFENYQKPDKWFVEKHQMRNLPIYKEIKQMNLF